MWNEVKTQQWESTAGAALQAWLLPFSPDNGVSSWFKRAPAVHTLASDAKQFYVCVHLSLQAAALQGVWFSSADSRWPSVLFCWPSGRLQNVLVVDKPLQHWVRAGALWPVRRWLLIRFNSWLISLNRFDWLPVKPAGFSRDKMTAWLWSPDGGRCWCRNAGQGADPADSTVASLLAC